MNADGWVVIGSKLDTKELEKEINGSLSELRKYEKEAERLTEQKTKIELDLSEYEREKQAIQESTDARLKFAQTEEQVNWVLDEEKMQIEQLNSQYSKQFEQLETINEKIKSNASAQEAVKNKVRQMNDELKSSRGFDSIKSAISSIGGSMEGLINKVTRWGLAIFGIRSAYMLVRRAISLVSGANEEVAGKIEQMRNVLANALLPVVQTIINFIAKMMVYINYIWKVLTGKTLFNFSTATKKASSNLSSGAGSSGKIAKNLEKARKQIAGFDEMNVLQENAASGGAGGAGGAGGVGGADMGNMFDALKDIEPPGWLQTLGSVLSKIKEILLPLLAGILTFFKVAGPLVKKLGLQLGLIKALGISVMVAGVVYAIQSLIKYLKDPSWKNFGKVIQGIGVAVIGIGIAFLGLPGIIAGVVILIWGTIVKYWDQIEAFLRKGIEWLTNQSDFIHKKFGDTIGNIYDSTIIILKGIVNWISSTMKLIKANFDEIIKFVKNVFAGNWKAAWQNIKNIFTNIWKGIKNTFNTILSAINTKVKSIASTTGRVIGNVFRSVVNAVLRTIENVLNSPIRTINSMIGAINKLPGVSIGSLPTFNLPRLAQGGIVNNPGPGVIMGSYVAGESGPEAVIPLNDSTMNRLGESIARHMVINANITNTMNGRVISRELKKVQNEDNFAFNR